MAIIHRTTMIPGKLELLAAWLPAQPWYLDRGREPELAKAGGFRLDDPQGDRRIRRPGHHLPGAADLPRVRTRRSR
jgi:Maltokinase N-terminal cap domain